MLHGDERLFKKWKFFAQPPDVHVDGARCARVLIVPDIGQQAVTRQNAEGEPAGGWMPEQRMTREQALRAFTLDAAYAAFEEREKGSLEVGKLADFVVVDRDVMACEEREILGTRVVMTVVGGETVWEAR